MTARETGDALQEIHDEPIKDALLSACLLLAPEEIATRRVLPPLSREKKKNTGKRNLQGPGAASRLQAAVRGSHLLRIRPCVHLHKRKRLL